jgi:ABC-type transport system involved in cytochrome bd biosynthesis fused ATPase/permease subunit
MITAPLIAIVMILCGLFVKNNARGAMDVPLSCP